MVYDGRATEADGSYEQISYIVYVNGKQAYKAEKDGRQYLVYDGKEIGGYEMIRHYFELKGKLAFIAMKDNKWYLMTEK
jgi:hypothetical protein